MWHLLTRRNVKILTQSQIFKYLIGIWKALKKSDIYEAQWEKKISNARQTMLIINTLKAQVK